MTPQMLMPMIMAPLMAFGVYRRIRRTFGPQPIQRGRMILRMVFLGVVGLLIAATGLHNPSVLEGMLGGVLIGALLAGVGLKLTKFDRNAKGEDVYVPNPWIGGLLTALLVGRLVWRFMVMETQMGAAAAPTAPQWGNSPLTLLIFGLMIGYYVGYFAGLLIHHRRFEQARDVIPPP